MATFYFSSGKNWVEFLEEESKSRDVVNAIDRARKNIIKRVDKETYSISQPSNYRGESSTGCNS